MFSSPAVGGLNALLWWEFSGSPAGALPACYSLYLGGGVLLLSACLQRVGPHMAILIPALACLEYDSHATMLLSYGLEGGGDACRACTSFLFSLEEMPCLSGFCHSCSRLSLLHAFIISGRWGAGESKPLWFLCLLGTLIRGGGGSLLCLLSGALPASGGGCLLLLLYDSTGAALPAYLVSVSYGFWAHWNTRLWVWRFLSAFSGFIDHDAWDYSGTSGAFFAVLSMGRTLPYRTSHLLPGTRHNIYIYQGPGWEGGLIWCIVVSGEWEDRWEI